MKTIVCLSFAFASIPEFARTCLYVYFFMCA